MKETELLTAVLGEIERVKEQERIKFFVPNGPQAEFIRGFGEGKYFINLFVGGNGAGKTAVMMNVIGNILWGPQSKFFDYPIFRSWPYPKRIRIVTESKDVSEGGSIDEHIQRWWPRGRYKGDKAGKPYISQYKTDTGFLIDKMSFEQEPKEFESVTLGMVCFNEPPPKPIYSACIGRLRQGGKMSFHMTPLMNSAYIQDEIIDSHNENSHVIYADIEDNCREHGVNGVLEHEFIQKMLETWDAEEIEARAHGRFMHMSNVILGKLFDRKVHVVPDDLKAPYGSQWGMGLDPASGKPWAMAWYWVDPRGQVVIDREYPLEDFTKCKESALTIHNYSDIIRQMDEGNQMVKRIIDRHYANARDNYGHTLKEDLLDKFKLEFEDSYNQENEIEQGIQAVKDYVGYDKRREIDTLNFPKLLVKERCKNVIRALERWQRNPLTLDPESRSPYKDHFDVVRYIVKSEPMVEYSMPMTQRASRYVIGR